MKVYLQEWYGKAGKRQLPKRFSRAKRKYLRNAILTGWMSIEQVNFKGIKCSHFFKPPDPEICRGTVEEVADLMSEARE
jgi:hypothetical protein